jgi:ABC-type phosphate transport system substrate-binding protein
MWYLPCSSVSWWTPSVRQLEVLAVRRLIIAGLAAFMSLSAVRAAHTADAAVRVIVHPQVKGSQIPRATLAAIFLKQAPRWTDGTPVVPVDQSVKSPVRGVFSNRVLNQPLMDVQIYWQRKMSAGLTPPPVKTSDEEVIAFVAATPGAIGYVSVAAGVPDSVKAIEILN